MNLPSRGGLLFLALAALGAQEVPPPRPDLAARFASILEKGPDARRDLAGRALLGLGRPGHDALKRVLAARPELAKTAPPPGDLPPALALVRIPAFTDDEMHARDAVAASAWMPATEASIRRFGTLAETYLWEALDVRDAATAVRAGALLRGLYTPPNDGTPGRPSDALRAALDRKRDFDVSDRTLADFLTGESFSWILMSPRDERFTLRLRGATLRDFLRSAAPKLAAVPVGDLLVLVPADRVASTEPGDVVWAPSELAARIESALDALALGNGAPIDGLTGVGAYHALKRAARSGGAAFTVRADAMRKLLDQRVFFIDGAADDGPPLDLSPTGTTARETVAAFEKSAGFALEVLDRSRLDLGPPAFRFRGVPARLAARALAFRLNRVF